MTGRSGGWVLLALLAGWAGLVAQESKPRFEVASIKPQREPISFTTMATASPRVRPGGLFTASHATVTSLMIFAYGLQPFQVTGGPDWAQKDAFDVSAKAGSDAPTAEIRRMVQSLLEDRFKLVAHSEQREMRFYELMLARPDGRPGPYLASLPDECDAATAAEAMKKFPPRAATTEDGIIEGRCARLSDFANLLSAEMETPVVDRTGLSGRFVYSVRGVALRSRTRATSDTISQWPSVPAALEEQLGLKLQLRRGPLEVLVIDSVQRPTEN